jgi:signal transduction histidine kinase
MSPGSPVPNAYTRGTMETGTLGTQRQAEVDALYAQAKQVLAQDANQLRAVTERLRETYGAALQDYEAAGASGAAAVRRIETSGLVRDRSLLARLDAALRDMEQSWLFLERGVSSDLTVSGRWSADQPELYVGIGGPSAMQILEAQEAERTQIAEELHDGPAQALANAVFQVDIIDRTLTTDPGAVRGELLALRRRLERELETLRGFIHQLHPALSEGDGLNAAIEELAQRMQKEDGIRIDVQLAAPQELLDLMRSAVALRVTQEALRNVHKHSAASQVRLSTFLEPPDAGVSGLWVLEVADNGRGFSVDEVLNHVSKRNFGVRFMRERAQLIGARLEIVSKPAAGTTVRLAIEPGARS